MGMEMEAGKILEFVRVGGIVSALFVVAFSILTIRLLREATNRVANTFSSHRLVIEQVSAFLRFLVYVLGGILVTRAIFTFSSEVLTVVGGTIVVTVGLVLKDQAASILAGVIVLFEKPFQVGDRVSFGGYYGEIRGIGLRSVTLVTLDDNQVTIPNSKFLTDPVASANSGELTMLVQIDFYIGVDQNIPRARSIVEEALTSSCYFWAERPWVVLVNQTKLESIIAVRLRAKAYVVEIGYEKLFESDVNQRVLEKFQEESILPPAFFHRPSLLPTGSRREASIVDTGGL